MARRPVHRALLRLEAIWWLLRPATTATAFIAVPGWLAATGPAAYGRMAAMVGSVMLGRAIANILNDLLDEPKDRVTAPELPLPSGIVTRPQAIVALGVLVAGVLGLLWIAGDGWTGFLVGLLGSGFCAAMAVAYSLVKPYASLALLVTGLAYVSAPVTAWLVAGGGWSAEVGIVFAYGMLRGVAANVFSTYRDVDRDGEVGNRSVAVRLGARRAFALGIGLEACAALCVLAVALQLDAPALGLLVTAVSLALLAFAFRVAAPDGAPEAGEERALLALPIRIARNHAGIVLVQAPPVGLLLVGLTAAAIACERLYERRIIGGGLRAAMAAAPAPAVRPPARAEQRQA